MWKIAATLGLSFSFAIGAAGCGDTTSNTPPDMTAVVVPHNFDQINTQILGPSCAAFSVCHNAGAGTSANFLDLKTDPYKALVGALSVNAMAKGQGMLRVKPCDSHNSFMILKLTLPQNQDPMTGYGHYMPDTNPHLDPAIIQAISDWIDRGALKSEPATVTGKTCTLVADMARAVD